MKYKSILSAILSLTMLFSISTIASAEEMMQTSSKQTEVIDQHFGDPAHSISEEEAERFVIPYEGYESATTTRAAIDDNTFYIRNKRTGQYLTADSSNNAIVTNYTGAENQKWELTTVDETFFKLHPLSAGSTYYLDVDGSYNANESLNTYLQNNTNVQIFNNGSTNYLSSQWGAMYCMGGSYLVVPRMSYVYNGVYYGWEKNKYLSCRPGSNNVIQYEAVGIDDGSNHWFFEPVNSQPFEGYLDKVDGTMIGGWAYNPNNPNAAIDVRIVIRRLSTGECVYDYPIKANGYRSDLAAAGKGNGCHAFSHPIDWKAYPSGEYIVRAYAYSANELTNSPKYYTVSSNESYYENLGWTYPLRGNYYNVSAPYGQSVYYSNNVFHHGLDIAVGSGTPVYAVDNARVVAVDRQERTGAGNYVVIEVNDTDYWTGNKLWIAYYHLSSIPNAITANQTVNKNTIIGYSGNTGNSTGPHLHISVITDYDLEPSEFNTRNPAWFFPNTPFTGNI